MQKKRQFLKKGLLGTAGLSVIPSLINGSELERISGKSSLIEIPEKSVRKPLEEVTIKSKGKGTLVVLDGMGREYFRTSEKIAKVQISGALGHHLAVLLDEENKVADLVSFNVDCRTELEDSTGKYKNLLVQLLLSMTKDFFQPKHAKVWDDKIYRGFIITSRDHAHGLKGMKYFYPHLKEWMDAFAKSQREDGMIFDFFTVREHMYHMEWRFPSEFYKVLEDDKAIFARQPMMNDVEHMFIHGVYWTWKSTGDKEWMEGKLDNCLKAVEYATSNPYIWSEKFQLLKRTFTIDTWDFQSEYDAAFFGGDIFMAKPGVSEYGVMFGDNTGMAISCYNLSEMLEIAGRNDESKKMKELADTLLERIGKLAWNGEYYRMFIPENPDFKRDVGVDPDEVVTLSNAYSLNRKIEHEKAVAIIKTYQRLKEETKDFAPAEWYCSYPPFPKGFERGPWHYVNGGVSPMVAGELAHGAFEHGYEIYAADIIERVIQLLNKHGKMPGVWRGKIPDMPEREFYPFNFATNANISIDEVPMDLVDGEELLSGKQHYQDVAFEFANPTLNKGKSLILLSDKNKTAQFDVNRKMKSLYFLHAVDGGHVAGSVILHYADGTSFAKYMINGEHVERTWNPKGEDPSTIIGDPTRLIAFTRRNEKDVPVGLIIYGMNNPHPGKTIQSVELRAADDGARWLVAGITGSDYEVFFMPGGLSRGIPTPWSNGAMVYALMEGLAGIYDEGANYSKVKIAPRWAAAGEKKVDITAKYEAGGGYVSYQYRLTDDKIDMVLTSGGKEKQIDILLPVNKRAESVRVNDRLIQSETKNIESSVYVSFLLEEVQAANITINLA